MLQSRVGGLAGLQAAVILDSQGESEAAQKLYRQLQGHAVAHVSRKAKQMLFGFKAAKFLKVCFKPSNFQRINAVVCF